jgi:hypothetical protein
VEKKMKRQVAWLAPLAVFAVACADPSGPTTRALVLGTPDAAIITDANATYPFPSSNGIFAPTAGNGDGWVRLCKVSNTAGTFNFDYAVNGAVDGNSDVSITIAAGEVNTRKCVTTPLYNSDKGSSEIDVVNVVELNPGANWTTTVDIEQHYVASVPVYHANSLADQFNDAARSATAYINDDLEKIVVFRNTYTAPPSCNNGCTPGYWKQDQHFDSWNAPYDPTDDFDTTFGVNFFNPNINLLAALQLGGGAGGKNQLARAAVAALLNAAEGFYPMTEAQVIAAVAGATPATYESVKNTLDANNNLGCPLN